ncbi:MAG: XRE family transcriptional regulator [SAR86 cluster bacterium]|uniref:XRE family transcriptional regulator n=1 Tax=SAR86 cluster bacterium TaxID=2030880 RepID=A0A2A5ASX4_9GAMM|nr:MAG: XRE family transcriptional regulator [SAR86 cluster bacterium]
MIVRKYRLKRGWSQRQLAEMTGVTTRTIQRIEQGHRPSIETCKALASVFEVDFHTILAGQSNPEKYLNDPDNLIEESQSLSYEEQEALIYAKRIKEFYEVSVGYILLALIFFVLFQGNSIILLIFSALGLCIVIQGLIAFEVVGFLSPEYERKLAEKRLKRKL